MTEVITKLDPDQRETAKSIARIVADSIPPGATAAEFRQLSAGTNLGLPGERLLIALYIAMTCGVATG